MRYSGRLAIALSLACTFTLVSLFLLCLRCFALDTSTVAGATSQDAKGATKVAAASAIIPPFKGDDSGSLSAVDRSGHKLGQCPLKHTAVTAHISGYVARVTVKQVFTNPFKDTIEAVYTFPLSQSGAVDDMLMKVGDRVIHGTIKAREEARQIYEKAKAQGQVASLLEQERPNIFTQSVANIRPGHDIEITLQYIDLLPYDSGAYTFAFPTVVGPRFIPGEPTESSGTGWSPDTTKVPDASKITPPVTDEGTRAGHDISIDVSVDAGMPIGSLESKLHEVNVQRRGQSVAVVSLKDKDAIPNKDFVLSWRVAGDRLQSGYLAHKDGPAGYFTLMLMPPKSVTPEKVSPKEVIFVIDTSGSQRGAPIEKAKETANYIIDRLGERDTFQVMTFNNNCAELFEKLQPVNFLTRLQAKVFITTLSGGGGTVMGPAVEKVCSIPTDEHRLRIVALMTDGFIGNDFEILGLVRKLRGNSRWFPFGTGNSVNRFLIDGMAKEGGGEAEYVMLNSPGQEIAESFYKKIAWPVLTDVKVEFGDLPVAEVFPVQVSDVWAQRPLYFKGRYTKAASGTVKLTGFAGGKSYEQNMKVDLPDREPSNRGIPAIWARAKVDRLMSEDLPGAQRGSVNKELKDEIVKVALEHHIMTEYTSFVAVEEKVVNEGGKSRTVVVPVEMPEGVTYEGVFGTEKPGTALDIRKNYLKRFPYANTVPGASRYSFAPNVWHAQGGSVGVLTGSMAKSGAMGQGGSVVLGGASMSMGLVPPPPPVQVGEVAPQARPAEEKLSRALKELLSQYTVKMGNSKVGSITITDGKILVAVRLIAPSPESLHKLQSAGLQTANIAPGVDLIVGYIAVERLKELSQVDEVLSIEPAT